MWRWLVSPSSIPGRGERLWVNRDHVLPRKWKKVNVSKVQKEVRKRIWDGERGWQALDNAGPSSIPGRRERLWVGRDHVLPRKRRSICLGYRKRWEKEHKMERQRLTATRSCRALWPFKGSGLYLNYNGKPWST